MEAFKNQARFNLTKFEVTAIANSTHELILTYKMDKFGEVIPEGKAYLSQSDENGQLTVMAWVCMTGLTALLRIEPGSPTVRIRTEYMDDGNKHFLYRQVGKSQRQVSMLFPKFNADGMERELPASVGNFYVDFQALGEAVVAGCIDNKDTEIDHVAYGVAKVTDEEIEKRRAAYQAKVAESITPEAPVVEAVPETVPAEAPKSRGKRLGSKAEAEPATVVAPTVPANADYDPFEGK